MIYFALLLVTPARFCLEAKQKTVDKEHETKTEIYM